MKLGEGAFGTVFHSQNIKNPDFHVAIKALNKADLGEEIELIKDEIDVLNKIDHPYICKYYETYDDVNYIYLVMEYISGNTIFEKVGSEAFYGEPKAAKYIK